MLIKILIIYIKTKNYLKIEKKLNYLNYIYIISC